MDRPIYIRGQVEVLKTIDVSMGCRGNGWKSAGYKLVSCLEYGRDDVEGKEDINYDTKPCLNRYSDCYLSKRRYRRPVCIGINCGVEKIKETVQDSSRDTGMM